MNILSNPQAIVYIVAVSWLFFLTRHFIVSKIQVAIGRKDLAAATRARSRRLCWAHARPAIRAWNSLRQTHRQTFPKNLSQSGAIGHSLSQAQDRQPRRAGRQAHQGGQKKASSSNDDGDGDGGGEPPHQHPLQTLEYQDLAPLFHVSPDTLKNVYSRSPELLPPAVHIPGHRGPLWLPSTVLRWLEANEHPAPVTPAPKRRKAGRPRIAQAGKVGAQ